MGTLNIAGHIVDVLQRTISAGTIVVADGHIQAIHREAVPRQAGDILPGFVDAHVHIESSLLVPSEFARLATVHGTVAMVSDPHEIANVLGLPGIRLMRANAAQTPCTIGRTVLCPGHIF